MQKTGKATLRYTRRKPNKEGWYWVRCPNGWEVVGEVWDSRCDYYIIDLPENYRYVRYVVKKETDEWWFAGPIPQPKPPEFPGKNSVVDAQKKVGGVISKWVKND